MFTRPTTQFFSVLIFAGSILFPAILAQAQDDVKKSPRPYLGVKLDPNPLPKLLVKHLNLAPDVGLLIKNIQLDSPADKAGLEKDDIILRFEGRDITSYPQIVDAIRDSGIGKEIQLEILHNGQRQKITLTLEAYQETIRWKYPFEKPNFTPPFRPGRMFRLDPDHERWQQIPFPNLPYQNDYFNRFFEPNNPPLFHLPGPDIKIQPPSQYHHDRPPRWNLAPDDFNERLKRLEKRQDELLERLDAMSKEKNGSK